MLETAGRGEVDSPLGVLLKLSSSWCLTDLSKATETFLRKSHLFLCFFESVLLKQCVSEKGYFSNSQKKAFAGLVLKCSVLSFSECFLKLPRVLQSWVQRRAAQGSSVALNTTCELLKMVSLAFSSSRFLPHSGLCVVSGYTRLFIQDSVQSTVLRSQALSLWTVSLSAS